MMTGRPRDVGATPLTPPSASTTAADLAMATAADPTNTLHAPAILAAGSTTELSTASSN
jgi:hypothetical protein